jgi:hypothetical protein
MGADLLIAHVKKYGNTRMDKRERQMLKHLEKMRIKPDAWEDFYNWSCDKIPPLADTIRKDAGKAIKDFFACQDGREMAYILVKDVLLIISGGMSWGDAPTECFDIIGKFGCMPPALLDAGGFK